MRKTAPSARVIADSISTDGDRLTTMEVVMHRFVLAEFNTHRVFSRNSASSRAIPVEKQIERVANDPAMPVSWPAEKPGMQGGEELDPIRRQPTVKMYWQGAAHNAVVAASVLSQDGVHKSVVNRVLEPFLWHTVIVSATDWDGFWQQRCTEYSPLAQPEMRAAADAMLAAYRMSVPTVLEVGDWHLPYVTAQERLDFGTNVGREISTARCARVSYLTHDGILDPGKDIGLYHKLVTAKPMHASPLEHVATPCLHREGIRGSSTTPSVTKEHRGNFTGWDQWRHIVEFGPTEVQV